MCCCAVNLCSLSLSRRIPRSPQGNTRKRKKNHVIFCALFNDLFFNRYIVWNQPELELFCLLVCFIQSSYANEILMLFFVCFRLLFFLFSQLLVIAARYAAVLRRHDEIEREGWKKEKNPLGLWAPFFPLSAQVIRHGALVNCTRSESSLSLRSLTVCSQKGPIIKI